MNTKRDTTIDSIKGIGIILMVSVHGGGPFSHFINLFHMPIFFIATGFLTANKIFDDIGTLKTYCIKKAKTLWLPFVIINGLYVLSNNLFLKLGIYTDTPLLFDYVTGSSNTLHSYYSVTDTANAIAKLLCFASRPQLGAPTWFLRTLFFVTIFFAITKFISHFFKFEKLMILSFILACISANLVVIAKIKLPLGFHIFFAAYMAFYFGVFIKQYNIMKYVDEKPTIFLLVSFLLLVGLSFFGKVAMASAQITDSLFFTIVSVLGWIMLWCVVKLIPNMIKSTIAYIGNHSMYIFLLHLLAFKVVAYVYLLATGGNMVQLAAFPRIENVWWLFIPYTIVGVILPLIIEVIVKKIMALPKKL